MDRYRRSYRCTNRIVNERIEKRTLAIHKKKLKTTRRSVDNETPSSYGMPHLKKNLKKAQMLEDRYTEIEKQNRTLLAKMHSIMRNPSATTDNHNNYKKYSKSLNIRRRRENLDRIVHNNLLLLERLKTMEPYYDSAKWESDHSRSDKIMRQLMEFDYLESVPVAKPKRLTELLPEISPSKAKSRRNKSGWQTAAGVAVAANDKGGVENIPKKRRRKRSKRSRSSDVIVDDAVEVFQFPSLAVMGVSGEGDSAWDVSLTDVCGNPETGEQSYVVIRGEKVTRDKTSEIQLTIPELKAYCSSNATLMESLNTLQDGQRIYQILDGGMAALLANEILTNLRCAEDGQLQLLPTATSAAREIAESEDARTEDKGAASPRILKRAVKSANGERILITATQTDGEIRIRGFDPVAFKRAELVVNVAPDISEEKFEQTVLTEVTKLQMS